MRKRHSAIPSQTERILAVLQNGKTLTAHDMHQMGIMQCNMRFFVHRLAFCNLFQAGRRPFVHF